MTEYNSQSFFNILVLKNNLIKANEKELEAIYNDDERFVYFLNNIAQLIKQEKAFLLLDGSFIDKILNVFTDKRFNTDNQKILDLINNTIMELNLIQNLSLDEKEELVVDYWMFNETMRKIQIDSHEELLRALANDVLVYNAIDTTDFSHVNLDYLFLSSMNYFLKQNPDFFNNEERMVLTDFLIELFKAKGGFFDFNLKLYLKNFKNEFHKIEAKEE